MAPPDAILGCAAIVSVVMWSHNLTLTLDIVKKAALPKFGHVGNITLNPNQFILY